MKSFNLSPFDVSNWFVCQMDREAGDSITHLKLQKLIYYAQAWSIVMLGKSIFEEDFQAWAHGPVLPVVFHEYKHHSWNAIPACDCENGISGDLEKLLLDIRSIYGEKSARYLEELTHSESPWIEARDGLSLEARSTNIITKKSMKEFYTQLI